MKIAFYTTLVILGLVVLSFARCVGRYGADASNAVFAEFKVSELNRKYEWFKDAHAKLTSLQAQIEGKKLSVSSLKDSYAGVPRNQWTRQDAQTLSISEQELFGITATFNNLAAEYNSEMAKFHTAFTNAGTLPEDSELPRSVIQYK